MDNFAKMHSIMNSPLQENEKATLLELEARARELESELAGVQSAIAILRARMNNGHQPATGQDVPLAPAWDTPLPISSPPQSQEADTSCETGDIYLQSLPPYHALRNKWELGSGLEDAQASPPSAEPYSEQPPMATHLRLIGLLPDGTPWEQRIPFAEIAAGNGIIMGRDPGVANVELPDTSVSRAHVQFALNEQGLTVSDMGSTNGTTINGIPLSPYDNCRPLQDGDALTLGQISLQVQFI